MNAIEQLETSNKQIEDVILSQLNSMDEIKKKYEDDKLKLESYKKLLAEKQQSISALKEAIANSDPIDRSEDTASKMVSAIKQFTATETRQTKETGEFQVIIYGNVLAGINVDDNWNKLAMRI
jgi:chromosome segregation ATPase